MKHSDFIDYLKSVGVVIKEGKKHLKLYFNGKHSTCPRHPTKEISKVMVETIKKQLGLK